MSLDLLAGVVGFPVNRCSPSGSLTHWLNWGTFWGLLTEVDPGREVWTRWGLVTQRDQWWTGVFRGKKDLDSPNCAADANLS
ncbi:hypothetical protein SAMN04488026_11422 [Aliiruegeria lutimaris]|uniref:Uncharacterized protein n=1 Tax=Aliiruegeria lutimaris TaxID=571298 RepID=A0A1G9PIR3_9RHOB|nr:hypothetical protein SAMN04488026_11422 [Aliiruegeria lutimaris]